MANWTIEYSLRVFALSILSIFSFWSVFCIGKMVNLQWQKYLIWFIGVGIIASSFIMMVSSMEFPKLFLLWINYYHLYSDRLLASLIFEILPFVGVMCSGINAANKRRRTQMLTFGFTTLIVMLIILYNPFSRPI